MTARTPLKKLQTQIASLNDAQRAAVETIEGPVLVLAGPGTGKTQVLTLRIAHILAETDTDPRAILAMTFTDAAAKNMQQRLATLIGESAYKVHFSTFHAFCQQVISEFPEAFPFRAGSEPLNDLERLELVESLLQRLPLQKLKTVRSEFHYFREIQAALSDLKREAILPTKLASLTMEERQLFEAEKTELSAAKLRAAEEKLLKMEDMVLIYEAYQAELALRRRFDYDDMIAEVARAFANNADLLSTYQERYSYFLVDEYQDTNAAQNLVVDQLAAYWGEQANLFVVGDPHQSIYRFQGASLENTVNFVERYPSATVIRLEIGYRCPPAIYQAAASVIQHNPVPNVEGTGQTFAQLLTELAKPLTAAQDLDTKIQIGEYEHQLAEAFRISEQVSELRKQGVKAEDIAILYRDHSDVAELSSWLEHLRIPYHSDFGQNILLLPHIQTLVQLVTVCQQLARGQEATHLYQVLNAPWWGLEPSILLATARVASLNRRSFQDQLFHPFAEVQTQFPAEIVAKPDFIKLQGVFHKLQEWAKTLDQQTTANWLLTIMADSGLIDWLSTKDTQIELLRQTAAFQRLLLSMQKALPTLTVDQLLANLQTMVDRGLRVTVPAWQANTGFVSLSTVHSAKGKEWDYVFVLGLQDKKWGNAGTRKKVPLPSGILQHAELDVEDKDSDDRRLLYVAMTRAKKQLYLSYALNEQTLTKLKPLQPSFLIAEIDPQTVHKQPAQALSEDQERAVLQLQLEPFTITKEELSDKQRAFYAHLVSQFRLSATALNQYLESPELFIQNTLVALPQPTAAVQAYGIAIHAALEFLYRVFQHQKQWPPLEAVQQIFRQTIENQNITPAEMDRYQTHGLTQLQTYLQFAQELSLPPTLVALEKKILIAGGVVGQLPLTGKIDRIDLLDEKLKQVAVVDYKTGSDKSLNVIQGAVGTDSYSPRELALPESVRGRLKRQLLFYKLLLEHDPFGAHQVSHGIFEFVNESNGKVKQRQVALSDSDLADFKALIKQVSQEILSLDFLKATSN